jgi:hypothetical protein
VSSSVSSWATIFRERLNRLTPPVGATYDREAVLKEAAGHRFAHIAQADKADCW